MRKELVEMALGLLAAILVMGSAAVFGFLAYALGWGIADLLLKAKS